MVDNQKEEGKEKKKMAKIIIIGGGGLGNQIFQYAFLKKVFPNKNIIYAANLENLVELFDIEDELFLVPDKKIYKYIIWKIGRGVLKTLGHLRIFDYFEQNYRHTFIDSFNTRKGFFKNIKLINFGYFQSERFFSRDIKNKLIIKKNFLETAQTILHPFKDKDLIFVHIRRGDYLKLGAALPKKYYTRGINYFNKNLNNPFFIFISNDIEWVKKEFKLKNAYYSTNSTYIDFTLMTLCEYGIMSNSTFSYWGGYLMQKRKEVIFPKYWLGHREHRYSPIGIKPSWAKEMDVD